MCERGLSHFCVAALATSLYGDGSSKTRVDDRDKIILLRVDDRDQIILAQRRYCDVGIALVKFNTAIIHLLS